MPINVPALTETRSSKGVLWALLFGNFVIGTGVMAVPGALNDISSSLQVSVATAGQLVSTSALLICIGAPLFASFVGGWDRRRLLAWSMLWYALMHLACAFVPDFAILLPVRMLAVVPAAIFTPQAAACVGLLVPASRRGSAITLIFLGWSLASVLGLPLSALIAGTWGWRWVFGLLGLLSFASAAWVWAAMPDGIRPAALSARAWRETLRSPSLMLCILVTVLYSAGQFVVLAYFAPFYKAGLDITPGQLSLLFLWFGVFGVAGSVLMTRFIDRIGAARAVLLAVACMALGFLALPLGSSIAMAAVALVPWALGCFASNSAQQARLVGLAPALASGSIALNTSAMYAGQAIGAAGGGWLIAHEGMHLLSWAGFAALCLAMLVSWRAPGTPSIAPAR